MSNDDDGGKKKDVGGKKKGGSKKDTAFTSLPEFPCRLFPKDDEPIPDRSISYFSKPGVLFDALKEALNPDEWEEITSSNLGVFIQYYEMEITWASRVVHYILSFQLDCNKKHELWSLVCATPIRFSIIEFQYITGLQCHYVENLMVPAVEVTLEMKEFWEQMGVGVEVGPTYDQLVKACSFCDAWDREDRLRLGYLSILAAFIDAKSHSSPVKLELARLVMDLDAFLEYPWGRVAFDVLMESVKEADLTKTYHINGFVQVLQSWVFFAMPGFAEEYGVANAAVRDPPLLAYGGAKGRKNFVNGMRKQVQFLSLNTIFVCSPATVRLQNEVSFGFSNETSF